MKKSLESGASQREINGEIPRNDSSRETAQYEMTTSASIPNAEVDPEKATEYLSGLPLLFVAIGLALCAFCVGLVSLCYLSRHLNCLSNPLICN
jgi:hypothetical protein